jgi:hypothetical protein
MRGFSVFFIKDQNIFKIADQASFNSQLTIVKESRAWKLRELSNESKIKKPKLFLR